MQCPRGWWNTTMNLYIIVHVLNLLNAENVEYLLFNGRTIAHFGAVLKLNMQTNRTEFICSNPTIFNTMYTAHDKFDSFFCKKLGMGIAPLVSTSVTHDWYSHSRWFIAVRSLQRPCFRSLAQCEWQALSSSTLRNLLHLSCSLIGYS